MDIKAFEQLTQYDFIKFVIKNSDDIRKSIIIQKQMNYKLINPPKFAYSPMMPKTTNITDDFNELIKTQELANHINKMLKQNKLEGIINLQIHKILNLA